MILILFVFIAKEEFEKKSYIYVAPRRYPGNHLFVLLTSEWREDWLKFSFHR